MARIKMVEKSLGSVAGASPIKSKVSKARRALKGNNPNPEKAARVLAEGLELYTAEVAWRQRAATELAPALEEYDHALKGSIGVRLQRRLTSEQAEFVSRCKSVHRDISLNF